MEESPAVEGDGYAGVLTWWNGETAQVSDVKEAVPGRMQWMRVRARIDGTRMILANVYVPPRKGSPSAAERQRLTAVRAQLQAVADEAHARGSELAVAGDLQSQTARALQASKAPQGNEYDAWLEKFTTENNLRSAGEVQDTYTAGEGGPTTAIDHILLSAGLHERAEVEVGAGADGLHTGIEGEGDDSAIGQATKGHNSLQMRLRLDTAEGEEGEEEEMEKREAQLKPMDLEEWAAYVGEEEATIAEAADSVTDEGHGSAARRLEAMENAAKALVKRVKDLGEKGAAQVEGTKEVRMHKKTLRWRRWLRTCDEHSKYADTHRAFNTSDCAGAFGEAPQLDAAFAAVVAGSEPGKGRREALREECRRRYLKARSEYNGEVAAGAVDIDRVRTRLLAALARTREEGGAATWEFFKAVGRAKAELAGKKTQPMSGRPGMTAVRVAGASEAVTGSAQVLRAIQEESKSMHQERGAPVAPALRMVCELEWADMPMLRREAVIDARTPEEVEREEERAEEAEKEDAKGRQEWRVWRASHQEKDALEALDTEEGREFARGLRSTMERLITETATQAGMQRFREVQGVGVGGFSGVWIARASEASQERYMQALRGAAADVRAAADELEQADTAEKSRAARAAVRRAAPEGWTNWLVILLNKPGKPLDVVSKRRDIYLQPHSLKLLMNGFKPHYDRAQRMAQPESNTGFRPGGSATQSAMALGLMREEAACERKAWYRGYCDKKGFFQSVVRRVQRAVEARCGVPQDVTAVVMALHECLVVRYDSGKGLTPRHGSKAGNGQGDTMGAGRSMEPLAIETHVVDWLVQGCEYRVPVGVEKRRTPQVNFADDGAFEVDSFSMLQVVFTVISVTSRVLGFDIGIDTDADGTPNGDKTGWSAAEPREGGGYAEAGEERSIWLIDGRRVPRVKGWYKHLGVRAVAKMGWEAARAMVVARCVGMAAALARLGVLSAGEYVEAVDVATLTVIAYYGAIFPIGRDACEQIDKAKRRGLAMLGHTGPQAARWLVHTPRPVGLGLAVTWVHAAAALTVEMDRAMQANASAPARVAATARMAATCWTMGWRPTQKEPTPAAYNPRHAIPVLGEEGIAEAVLKYRLIAGVKASVAAGDGAACAMSAGYRAEATGEGATAPIWAQEGRTYGWRLARLGAVQRRHYYTAEGSVDAVTGERRWRGRWRTMVELGEYVGRKGGVMVDDRRHGARLTPAEQKEYTTLQGEMTEEENQWAATYGEAPMARPAEAHVTEVLGAGRDRCNRVEYLLRWSDGSTRWAPRPTRVQKWARQRMQAAKLAHEEGRAGDSSEGGELRARLRATKGEPWLYLATEAPMAVGARNAEEMVAAAEAQNVRTARLHYATAGAPDLAERAAKKVAEMNKAKEADEAEQGRGGDSSPGSTDDSDEGLTLEELTLEEGPLSYLYSLQEGYSKAPPGKAAEERALAAAEAAEGAECRLAGKAAQAAARTAAQEAAERGTGSGTATKIAMKTEAEWVAARARRAAGELAKELVKWATAKPEHGIARSENAEGAGASARATEATAYRPSARAAFFYGTLGEPGPDGRRKRVPGLEVEAALATRARGLGMRVPRVEDAHADGRVAWAEEDRMWSSAEEPTGERIARTERNRTQAIARRAAAAAARAQQQVLTGRRAEEVADSEHAEEGGDEEEARGRRRRNGNATQQQEREMQEAEARRDEAAAVEEHERATRWDGEWENDVTEEQLEVEWEIERERAGGGRTEEEGGGAAKEAARAAEGRAAESRKVLMTVKKAAETARAAREREVRELRREAQEAGNVAKQERAMAESRYAQGAGLMSEYTGKVAETEERLRRAGAAIEVATTAHEEEEEQEAQTEREAVGQMQTDMADAAAKKRAAGREEAVTEEEAAAEEAERGRRAAEAAERMARAAEGSRTATEAARAAKEAREAETRREEERAVQRKAHDAAEAARKEMTTESRATREERRREQAEEDYAGVEYWEDMGERMRREIGESPTLRVCVRRRALEQEEPDAETREGVAVGMESKERRKIDTEATKQVVAMGLAVEKEYGVRSVYAVDGSSDEAEARRAGEVGERAAAWGSWDGEVARGGALPPGTGNVVAELVAIERTIEKHAAGDRILILCDCQSAL